MRTLIVSDIHSNVVALDAVFADAEEDEPVERVICLGDTVGYGPAPMECLERLWDRNAVSIQGNHDAAVAGTVSTDDFNPYASAACEWTKEQISEEAKRYLAELPLTLVDESFLLVHGTPRDPLWEYMLSYDTAIESWERTELSDILVGHSHIQFAMEAGLGYILPQEEGMIMTLGPGRIVGNPGSVGQPRDHDPRAGYILYDDEFRKLYFRRVWYDVSKTQRAMADAGLPERLITRLSVGA